MLYAIAIVMFLAACILAIGYLGRESGTHVESPRKDDR